MTWATLTPLLGLALSALVGGLTVWMTVRKRLEEESLGKASRRTTALQLLSDEECALEQVRDECVAIDTLVALGKFGVNAEHLRNEVARIRAEADGFLDEVRARRRQVELDLQTMPLVELESAIARAYHGKRKAEAQLRRTQLSRTEVLKAFQTADAA
jgi:hypothetical protein